MVEEDIRARLTEIEIQMTRMVVAIDEMKNVQINQMTESKLKMNQMIGLIAEMKASQASQTAALMAEVKALFRASREAPCIATMSNLTSSASTMERKKEFIAKEDFEEEILLKPSLSVIKRHNNKYDDNAFKDEEESRGWNKNDDYLPAQGSEHEHFKKNMPAFKLSTPKMNQKPKFTNQYDGTSCPMNHLKYFFKKMGDENDVASLLIDTFQDSLQGVALAWYINWRDFVEWEDLMSMFLGRFSSNLEILPNRENLVRIKKEFGGNFNGYAQRWRAMASLVEPIIQEDELIELFLKSIPAQFYIEMNTYRYQTFAALVRAGERVEWDLKEKRRTKKSLRIQCLLEKGKEHADEVAFVPNMKIYLKPTFKSSNQSCEAAKANQPKKKRLPPRQFSLLPRPLSKLLPMLLEERLVAKEVSRDPPPKFFRSDLSKSCEFHMGKRGHDVDNCHTLRTKVQCLLEKGIFHFEGDELIYPH